MSSKIYKRTRSKRLKDPAALEALSKQLDEERERDEKKRKRYEDMNKTQTENYRKYFEDLALAAPVADPDPNGVIGVRVPISTEQERASWLEFKKLGERNPIAFYRRISRDGCDQEKIIDLDDPFVPFLGGFVVDTFNKICEKAGVKENRSAPMDYKTVEVKYLNAFVGYYFKIKFSVKAKGISGHDEDGSILWRAMVKADRFNGSKTLLDFCVLDAFVFCGVQENTYKRQNEAKLRHEVAMLEFGLVKLLLRDGQEVYVYNNPLPEFEVYP